MGLRADKQILSEGCAPGNMLAMCGRHARFLPAQAVTRAGEAGTLFRIAGFPLSRADA